MSVKDRKREYLGAQIIIIRREQIGLTEIGESKMLTPTVQLTRHLFMRTLARERENIRCEALALRRENDPFRLT